MLFRSWGQVTPFVIQSGDQFLAPPPPALGSQEYTDAYNEVMSVGGDGIHTPTTRTAEQTEIGLFWGYDGTPGLGVPPRLYNQITGVICQQMGNTEVQNARLLALVNIAMADTGIAVWDTKYVYNFWRPITAIREGDTDGNPDTTADPNWTPLGAPADNHSGTNFTPPFPAYTSGHAGFGAALFRTLADFYGTDDVTFTIGSDEFNGRTLDARGKVRPVIFRTFNSFSAAAEENGQSRIYLGIHWHFDKVEGIMEGDNVADYVFSHALTLRSQTSQTALVAPPGSGGLAVVAVPITKTAIQEPHSRDVSITSSSTQTSKTDDTPPLSRSGKGATSDAIKSVDELFATL